MPFPSTGSRRAVSSGGGALPRWSREGRELFYVSFTTDTAHVTSAPMRLMPSLEIGKATLLFPLAPGRRWPTSRSHLTAGFWPSRTSSSQVSCR